LEQGIDSHVVSALLGHKSFKSTQRYAQVTRPIIRQTPSPLDLLPHRRR
jgi:site-specific recombinase XerD